MQFTVFFDPPFWVGVLEAERDGILYAARHVFGAQPSDQHLYTFVLHHLDDLAAQMTVGVPVEDTRRTHRNPKRVQREIQRELARSGVRKKAHEAMRQQIEQGKQQRQLRTRAERDATQAHKRDRKRDKARRRHRGR